MDILNLLEKIEDIVEEASKVPLSNKVMIDKEDVLEVINDIRLKLPDEINRASWVSKERQRILSEAQKEADELVDKTKEHRLSLIDDNEITRYAKQEAARILDEAERRAHEMKVSAYNYSDSILGRLQEKIIEINNIIEENRQVLKKM